MYHLYRWSGGWALWQVVGHTRSGIMREFIVNSLGDYPLESQGNNQAALFEYDGLGWSEITLEEAKKYKLEVL